MERLIVARISISSEIRREAWAGGGTGVATEGSDIFYRNPASIARSERFNMGVQYGTLQGTFYNPDLSLAIPTHYGVFGFSFRYAGVPESHDFNHGYGFSLGAAKDITSYWMLGLSLNFLYAGNHDRSLLSGGHSGDHLSLSVNTG